MATTAILVLMPIIATVAGVKIYMYYKDHNPPHFHAEYSGEEEVFDLKGKSMKGSINSKKSKKVRKWAESNKDFLEEKWDEFQK